MRPHTALSFLALACGAFAVDAATHSRIADVRKPDEDADAILRRDICVNELENQLHTLSKRADTGAGVGVGVGANVSLPSVGLSLGNITTKIGNINLTVTNVTIAVGNVDVENIQIGNITVIVSIPLPGASPIQAFSAFSPGSSIATSTASPTSTVSSDTSATQPGTTITSNPSASAVRARGLTPRQDGGTASTVSPTPTTTDTSIGVGATGTVDVSGNPITLDTGSVSTEIGNISIFVGHVNVSIGDVKIKNVTIGNIFVLVQVGQPDLAGLVSNVTNRLLDGA